MADNGVIIEDFTEEERKAFWEHEKALLKWAQSLSQEQIDYLCNGGWYNNTMKGYLIAAAQNADLDREQTDKLLQGLGWAFSDIGKADADKIYMDW